MMHNQKTNLTEINVRLLQNRIITFSQKNGISFGVIYTPTVYTYVVLQNNF